MKNKSISLKWKLFLAILLFAAVIVLIFIIFQIALLGDFYRSNKISRTTELINEVTSIVDREEIGTFMGPNNSTLTHLENISLNEEAAIYLFAEPIKTVQDGKVEFTNVIVYKTISGSSFSKLEPVTINEIWLKAKNTPYNKFYAIMSVNPDPRLGNIQILDTNSPRRQLTRDLSSQNDSIMCCSFVTLSDNRTYLLVVDNKIIPVDSAVATLKMQLTYIAIIVVCLSIVIAIVVSAYISKPIAKLNASAKKMAKGNYDVVFDGKGYSEIDELNNTLNNTVSELKKTETLRRELMANVSHDLRTPLTMINGYAEMMRDLPGENNSENLQIIIDEVSRLNILVNDMLDLSRLSSKTIQLHPQIYSITDNLIEIVDRYNRFQENSEFKFELKYDYNVNVCADESKIDQVIYNFINNAINYSGSSRNIEIVQSVEKNNTVKISITDHGIGMKQEDLDCIWDRYYRIDKGHQRSVQGSGLGLSIVKSILEYHNFEYGVESNLGSGSTFWFKMPINK